MANSLVLAAFYVDIKLTVAFENGDFVYRMTDCVARLRSCSRNDGCTSLRTIIPVARGSCQFYIMPDMIMNELHVSYFFHSEICTNIRLKRKTSFQRGPYCNAKSVSNSKLSTGTRRTRTKTRTRTRTRTRT